MARNVLAVSFETFFNPSSTPSYDAQMIASGTGLDNGRILERHLLVRTDRSERVILHQIRLLRLRARCCLST